MYGVQYGNLRNNSGVPYFSLLFFGSSQVFWLVYPSAPKPWKPLFLVGIPATHSVLTWKKKPPPHTEDSAPLQRQQLPVAQSCYSPIPCNRTVYVNLRPRSLKFQSPIKASPFNFPSPYTTPKSTSSSLDHLTAIIQFPSFVWNPRAHLHCYRVLLLFFSFLRSIHLREGGFLDTP